MLPTQESSLRLGHQPPLISSGNGSLRSPEASPLPQLLESPFVHFCLHSLLLLQSS